MKRPGEYVSLRYYVDPPGVITPETGDVLQTRTGRRYVIVLATPPTSPEGPWKLGCRVLKPTSTLYDDARVLPLRWLSSAHAKAASKRSWRRPA